METREIPDKMFFAIREVSKITGVEAYVLRYWESEFTQLSPRKSRSGHRTYQKKDIEIIFTIKQLLHEYGYTIAGAKKQLLQDKRDKKKAHGSTVRLLKKIKGDLLGILKTLNK